MKVRLHGSIVQWDCPECNRSNTQTAGEWINFQYTLKNECM